MVATIERVAAPATSTAPVINLRERRKKFTGLFRYLIIDYVLEGAERRIFGKKWVARRAEARNRRRARKFRQTAIELGGVLIKLGQYLSARYDLLSKEWIEELSKLQDNVPPVSFDAIRGVIEQEFGRPLDQIYASFDPTPLAAASLGQVHRATLPDGTPVAVKVLRPSIKLIIESDLESLTNVIRFLSKRTDLGKLSDLEGIAREFDVVLRRELDYGLEAASLDRMRRNLAELKYVYVPRYYADYSNTRVLTLEYIEGVKMFDRATVARAGFDPDRVARILVNAYFNMFLLDGFFHADPHPGNLMVRPLPGARAVQQVTGTPTVRAQRINITGAAADGAEMPEADPATAPPSGDYIPAQVVLLDFGMVGEISPRQQGGINKMIVGIAARDAQMVTQALDEMGFVRRPEDFDKVRVAVSYFTDRFLGRTMEELKKKDFGAIFEELGYIIYSNPLYLPADFAFFSRAAETMIGVVTGISPSLNLLNELRPFLQRITDQTQQSAVSVSGNQVILEQLRSAAVNLIGVPTRLSATLDKLDRGEISFKLDTGELDDLKRQIARSNRNSYITMAASAAVAVGALLYRRRDGRIGKGRP